MILFHCTIHSLKKINMRIGEYGAGKILGLIFPILILGIRYMSAAYNQTQEGGILPLR